MRKRKLLAVILSALCIAAAIPTAPAFADGQKVVTLGADLSEDQRQAILRYFGIAGQNIQTLTITNQDERDHLGSYVPLEQIGTHTYSCALVNPTLSGGIQVKTANLTWVTSNMIATTLSTSGVVNCEVLAAAPFEVSGTGALTGILMAYESAVGTELDTTKKEVATQELITTTSIANNIGQVEATDIVNEAKMQVVQGSVVNENDIDVIITNVAEEENVTLSEEDRGMLRDLMHRIAQQNYDYDDMKETLERVEQNMDTLMNQQTQQQTAPADDSSSAVASATTTPNAPAPQQTETETETPETLPADSILSGTDDSALGANVVMDATTPEAVETEAPAVQPETTEPAPIEITSSDEYTEQPEQTESAPAETEPIPADSTEETESIPADSTGEIETELPPADSTVEIQPDTQQPETVPEQVEQPVDDPSATAPEGENSEIDTMMPELGDPMFEVPDEPAAPVLTMIAPEEMEFAPKYEADQPLLPAGVNELTICFQRDDILAGTGAISLINGFDNSNIETIQANDTEKVSITPLSAEELAALGWSTGCKASILLKDPIGQMAFCYVTMTENAFTSADGTAMTPAIEDAQTWAIQTSEYGFCIDKKNLTVGSTVSGQIMMDNATAAAAYIENADPTMLTFDIGEFTASGAFSVTLNAAGKTGFQVSFYDAAGTLLNTISYELEIK